MRINPLVSVTVAAAALALTVGSALPASAADTTATFELTGGALEISAPTTSDLGEGEAGGDAFDAQLGDVTVTDDRGALLATWDATVSATDFTTGGGTPAETVDAAADVEYWSGPATATTGSGTFVPGQATAGDAEFIAAAPAFTKTTGAGNNSATWNPTLIVTAPAQSVVGVYTSTVTHDFL